MHRSEISTEAEGLRSGYIPELDGLRAVACLLVIVFHAAPNGLFSGGFLGVDMFFVLSGYLITSLLVAEWDQNGRVAVGQFYLHRALRLAPALLLFLTAYMVLAPTVWPGEPHLRDAGLAAFYLSDYTYPLAGSPQYLRHSWSLAVEEQFYLLWPLLVPSIVRPRIGIFLLASGWAIVTIARYMVAPGDWTDYYYPLHTHSSGLILGACLALAKREGWLNMSAPIGLLALFAFAILALTADITTSAVTITLAELLSGLIIACILCGARTRVSHFLTARPLIGLGKLSYGMYLWHFPVALYLRQDFGFLVTVTTTFGLALAGALISYHTVEAWGRAVRSRLSIRGAAATPIARASAMSADAG